MPELLPVITFEANGATSFHKQNADKIFSKIPPNRPVAVLGIAGNSRMGKSFALSALVVGMQNPEVLKNPETVFGGPDGVPFKDGNDAHTKGILIWSEPFEIKTNNGEALTVIIMDTQGTFDLKNNRVVAVKTFAIANLLCSMLVFNKMKMMDKNDLEALQLFVQFGQWLKENKGQHLVWLLRDFNGEQDGRLNPQYLEGIRIGSTDSTEITQSLMDMDKAFGKFSCFTLTTPERALQIASEQIKSSACGAEFIQGVVNFVNFIKNNIESKKMHGKDMFGSDLRRYLEEIVKSVQTGDVPEIGTAVQSMERISFLEAERECRELFQREIAAVPRVNISSENFNQMVNRASTSAMEGLRLKRMFCTPANRRLLSDRLHREFQTAVQREIDIFEKNKRAQEELEKEKRRLSMERRRLQNEHRERMERLDQMHRERMEQADAQRLDENRREREQEEKDRRSNQEPVGSKQKPLGSNHELVGTLEYYREIRRRLERKVDECVSGAFVAPERQRHFGKYSNGTHYAILVTEGLWYKVRLFKMGDSFSCSLTDTEHISEEGMRERVREIKGSA